MFHLRRWFLAVEFPPLGSRLKSHQKPDSLDLSRVLMDYELLDFELGTGIWCYIVTDFETNLFTMVEPQS